jgi:hypothetical protein
VELGCALRYINVAEMSTKTGTIKDEGRKDKRKKRPPLSHQASLEGQKNRVKPRAAKNAQPHDRLVCKISHRKLSKWCAGVVTVIQMEVFEGSAFGEENEIMLFDGLTMAEFLITLLLVQNMFDSY